MLSPSIWLFLTRIGAQAVLMHPRDADADRPLVWWLGMVFIFNVGSIWSHAVWDAADSSALMLDFIGMCACTLLLYDCI
jgi:hypothetical protein